MKKDGLYLVSSCLLGLCTRYDGGANRHEGVLAFCAENPFIPVCPEQLGGLPTPRPPAEIKGGDGSAVLTGEAAVVSAEGSDVTSAFLRGAEQVLVLAVLAGAGGAILKSRSPSCGKGQIHDGTFSGGYREGDGVTATLLKRHGIDVYHEEELPPPEPDQSRAVL